MKAILFDLDGVIYNADTPIPGAAETIAGLRRAGIPHLFLTNTSSHGRALIAEKMTRFGIPANADHILSPPSAAADWLRQHAAQDPVALFVPKKTHTEFHDLNVAEERARYVVVGDLGERWTFAALNRAFQLLHAGADLIALGMTKYWQSPDGLRLDVAPFVAALEHASGKRAMVFGKPDPLFFSTAARMLGTVPNEPTPIESWRKKIWMIGDDIEIDVAGAQNAGMKGLLVRTGKFRASDLDRGFTPDAILDSIADLPQWLQQTWPDASARKQDKTGESNGE
jgi:HAD superfamily hydrolase (TIGR01458 family)